MVNSTFKLRNLKRVMIIALGAVVLTLPPLHALRETAIARFGKPAYNDGFSNFAFTNSKAPKGGTLNLSVVGSYDSVNPFLMKGILAYGIMLYCHDPLMRRNPSEPFTLYGLIAQTAEIAKDHSSITFYLDPRAKFHDGSPITVRDIKFTYEFLRDHGPFVYRNYYSRIKSFEVISKDGKDIGLRLDLKPRDDGSYDPELPMIMAGCKPLPEHAIHLDTFAQHPLQPVPGSGPYKISTVDQGRVFALERVKDYWAVNLAVNKGMYNFDRVVINYYKNTQVEFQSLLRGDVDLYFDTNLQQWHTGYQDAPVVKDKKVVQVTAKLAKPVPVKTIIFNVRKPYLQDWRVRKALGLCFDFDAVNRQFFFEALECPASLFANTALAHSGPMSSKERDIITPYKDRIDPQIFDLMGKESFKPARTGKGDQREFLLEAKKLLEEAGWVFKDGKWTKSGTVLTLAVILHDPKLLKIAQHWEQSLKKIGVPLKVQLIDRVQYENLVNESNFDALFHTWANSLCPGNEQLYYFSAKNAHAKGSSNYIGVTDPVAEALAKNVTEAETYEELTTAVHALDRFVMHQWYQIPLAYDPHSRYAYHKDTLELPSLVPSVGPLVVETGWSLRQEEAEEAKATDTKADEANDQGLIARIAAWFKKLLS